MNSKDKRRLDKVKMRRNNRSANPLTRNSVSGSPYNVVFDRLIEANHDIDYLLAVFTGDDPRIYTERDTREACLKAELEALRGVRVNEARVNSGLRDELILVKDKLEIANIEIGRQSMVIDHQRRSGVQVPCAHDWFADPNYIMDGYSRQLKGCKRCGKAEWRAL